MTQTYKKKVIGTYSTFVRVFLLECNLAFNRFLQFYEGGTRKFEDHQIVYRFFVILPGRLNLSTGKQQSSLL